MCGTSMNYLEALITIRSFNPLHVLCNIRYQSIARLSNRLTFNSLFGQSYPIFNFEVCAAKSSLPLLIDRTILSIRNQTPRALAFSHPRRENHFNFCWTSPRLNMHTVNQTIQFHQTYSSIDICPSNFQALDTSGWGGNVISGLF